MSTPIHSFLDRCRRGFTLGQKLLWSAGLIVYIVSPIDLLPFIPLDDIGAVFVLIKVLTSPTIKDDGDPPVRTLAT